MHRNTITISAVVAAALSGSAMGGIGDSWYMSDFDTGFFSYQEGSGAADSIGSIPNYMVGIDFDDSGTLYGMNGFAAGYNFYSIDTATGVSTLIGNTGLDNAIEGDLAWDTHTQTMFACYHTFETNGLYTIDITTGAASFVGQMEEDDISGLAVDAQGQLWGVDTNTNGSDIADLLRIDKSTGAVLSRVSLGVRIDGPLLGLDLNERTGELAMAMDNGNFYTIDTTTGTATFVDTHGVLTATGLAYAVPAPGAIGLLMGAGLVGVRRRR